MARKDQDDEKSLKDKLNEYKKEIGKQYMDGLISDKEYEKLLHDKEIELGLNAPVINDEEKGPECPSCGALINAYDTECMICGVALEPVMDREQTEKTPHERPSKNEIPDNWREEWIITTHRDMPLEELLKQRPDVIMEVSKFDCGEVLEAFNIKTVEDFATLNFFVWAQELVALKENPSLFRKEDFKDKLTEVYKEKEFDEILQAPTFALLGLSEYNANNLAKAFNVNSIEELGSLKSITWAQKISGMAHHARVEEQTIEARIPEVFKPEEGPLEVIEKKRVCGTCGASVSDVDTICIVCGNMLGALTKGDEIGESLDEIPIEPEIGDLDEIPAATEKTCPSCGAFVEHDATECMICDTPIEATAHPVPAEMPPDDSGEKYICPTCKNEVNPNSSVCEHCGYDFVVNGTFAPKHLDKEKTAEAINECPNCGAVLEDGATECFICGTPEDIPAEVASAIEAPVAGEEVPAEQPEEVSVPPEEEEMPPVKTETVCSGCGAILDDGAEECFICGAKVGEEAAEEVPAPTKERIEDVSPQPIPIDHDLPPMEDEMLGEIDAEVAKEEELAAAEPATEQPAEEVQEIVLGENEIMCPSCSSVIPADSEKCTECWTDLSLYVKCPQCGLLTPAGEETCRECFAALPMAEAATATLEEILDLDVDTSTEQIEITEELKEEMTALEMEEEQGKECLVCGAIFGPDDQVCPICGIEYGIEIEEPEIPETAWGTMDVEIPPIIHTCPNCGENVTGLEATDREIEEGKWFLRGLIAIFTGIFFTSFSILARGISVENSSLGLHPPPTDVLLNLLGWILVGIGFLFWLLSWKLHEERTECPSCGIETDVGMAICINCGNELIETEDEEGPEGEEAVDEELLPEQTEVQDDLTMPIEAPQEGMPEDLPPEDWDASLGAEEDLEVPPPEMPEEPMPETFDEPVPDIPEESPEEAVPEMPEEPKVEAPEPHLHGEELPVDHEEHKKCPGCGIYVELTDTVCPICDTEFTISPIKSDDEIDVPSEEDEMANLEPVPAIDEAPKEPASVCPSCGADLEAGMKACPICEYPLN